ncbi:MAG: YbjQ family protein [Clostridiales bacterium]|nr:YbjQ family protein [Clostridiales bacterium]
MRDTNDIIVTTVDLKKDYDVIGPVYFQVSNKGLFSSTLSKLVKKYSAEIANRKREGIMSGDRADWGFLYGEWSVGQSDFEKAFFVAVEEMKVRAKMLGADAVIGMRQDVDLDTNGFQYFYLQMYGTAVKFKR